MNNIDNGNLEVCSINPVTGYMRDGFCKKDKNDLGNHLVCAKMDKNFMDFTKKKGNNLYSVVSPGENWCLCQERWLEAYKKGKEPTVIRNATSSKVRSKIKKIIKNQRGGKTRKRKKGGKRKTRKKRKTKKQFLYNPNNPKKSFDVYIDKNPKDTIPIKYTTVKDVEMTIKKLERLFKTKKYSHKRIWQVGMIMKVRLEAMLKHKKTKYPNAKNVKARFQLANRYFKFLGKRTKKKTFQERKKLTFNL